MRFRVISTIGFLFIIGIFAACGPAQAQRPNVDAFLEQWDTDHDGTLSLDESKKAAVARFGELDRNHKDSLTRSQLAGIVSYRQFRQSDINKDARLDKTEFLSLVEKLFQEADKDHDGTLDKQELRSPAGRALLGLFAARRGAVL